MNKQVLSRILLYAAIITWLFPFPLRAAENPKERIDFWQSNYDELLPKDDPLAAQAYEIFNRVLNVAGTKPGVIPRLFIVKNDAPYIPLAQALPDGGIVISKRVLDICYRDPERGDDRLAFILAHEIAHQLKEDFWHLKFFQAVELSKEENPLNKDIIDEVCNILKEMPKERLKKELEADEHGIIYASMAGFNTNAIVTEDNRVNFFEYCYKSLHPGNIKGLPKDSTHPTPMQRAEAVKVRLNQVLEMVELFNLGVLFYQAGDYQRAILFFSKFLKFFPSREVYHNLASSHHQLALKHYRSWKRDEQGFPFKLSIAIDPETRASKITLRAPGAEGPADLFKNHIEKAIKYYETAITLDPSYVLSYNNLGCALIMKGDVYDAVGKLRKAIKMKSDFVPSLNNLGVAFFLAENERKAKENLVKASEFDSAYDAPFFNLGKIAFEEKKEAEAKKYWIAYLELDSASGWADSIRKSLSLETPEEVLKSPPDEGIENIMGLEAGDYEDDISETWGKPVKKRDFFLEEEPFKVAVYKNGVKTLSQEDEIKMILTPEGFKGKSARGISISSLEKDVLAEYGRPSKVLPMTQGATWVYASEGIAFQLRGGKVVSWLLFY